MNSNNLNDARNEKDQVGSHMARRGIVPTNCKYTRQIQIAQA
jgi:hypothetical protein